MSSGLSQRARQKEVDGDLTKNCVFGSPRNSVWQEVVIKKSGISRSYQLSHRKSVLSNSCCGKKVFAFLIFSQYFTILMCVEEEVFEADARG